VAIDTTAAPDETESAFFALSDRRGCDCAVVCGALETVDHPSSVAAPVVVEDVSVGGVTAESGACESVAPGSVGIEGIVPIESS